MIRGTAPEDFGAVPYIEPQPPFDLEFRTLEIDGQPVAVFGYQTLCPGVGQCWVTASLGAPKYAREIIRASQHMVEEAFRKFNLHRLQTTILFSDLRMWRLMELCGFTAESVLTCGAADRSDLVLFRIVKGN